jgi:predicted transport protein
VGVRQGKAHGKLFSGPRSRWREPYDELLGKMKKFGSDVTVSPTDTYISILRKGKEFSVLQVTSDRMDIGIKLKGAPPKGRFEKAGEWNAMVTHRVRVEDPKQIDTEVISWLHQAYDKA